MNQPFNPASGIPLWLEVGQIVGVHGLRGCLKVRCWSDFPERLTQPGQRWLQRPNSIPDPYPVTLTTGEFLPSKNLYRVQFADIEDRTQAERWVGALILIANQDRPMLQPDEYYLPDLMGCEVFDHNSGVRLGMLTAVLAAGNDLLEVTPPQGKPIWIPFVKALVPVVNLAEKRIEVSPPPGLLESFNP
ncbi:MAG: ribosome maturation factor RimM [Cyanobacteriota bacterium]|nr:ribosome maturation factor RimM [Cyanobacteriota bacterium]